MAMDALDGENFGEAEAFCRRALMLRPASHDARQLVASALIEQQRFFEAASYLEEVLDVDEGDIGALADYGLCLFEMCEFENAEIVLARALDLEPTDPQACYWMALCIERRGQYQLADKYFVSAHEMEPGAYPLPARIPREVFRNLVAQAMAALPELLREKLSQVSIVVEDLPREGDLVDFDPPIDPCVYGLFLGIPLQEREEGTAPETPDAICLYQRNLERFFPPGEELVEEIIATLVHEIALYLGATSEEMAEMGSA